jgi:predicted enzyme related to lactoylglutathione lyase
MTLSFRYSSVFVALADPDFDRLMQFYTQLLETMPIVHLPKVYAEFHLSGLRLGIFNPREDHRLEFSSPSSGSMSLCFEVENLETAIAHLAHLGHPPVGPVINASHGREIYAYDPRGNRLILHEQVSLN